MINDQKKTVLVVGAGSVGAIAALNLEVGGLASVTVALRSNYNTVKEQGYTIESCDHGALKGFSPSVVRNTIPDITAEDLPPYDYIVICTKSVPDVGPTSLDLIAPALPKDNSHTALVLLQNGLNIEKPFLESHPRTIVLSGVSLIGSAEPSSGHIIQNEPDRLLVGAFPHPSISDELASERAKQFVNLYSAGGNTDCKFSPDVLHDRWRKLVYNACLNPICAITGVDSGRIRLADGGLDGLVRPAMREIVAAAKAVANVELAEDVVEQMINVDPLENWAKPSMQQDLEKGNFIEFENILGEPLREGKKAGVSMPTLEVLYQLARAIQWRTKEAKGLVQLPGK
ncbi:2-dehydropantoate 2-reductase-like protein [Boeremia exigua]|uniref:2-dehydropantoate 2-reductase-like protein n=1 Tax=Boeremia exigua TaxID=749465 RepID=UPI001E8CA5D9|nr:2-dehydropantoate 2-reductase-like protein [Boeremia exigua]KAH6643632.1 2-dehydropantoate 2-reductase-like protein [Boeremia exigua]